MRKLCLIGGGRWARVLINVLADVLPAHWQITWVTRHGQEFAKQWCDQHARQRVGVLPELSDQCLESSNAAVIATSPNTHFEFAKRTLAAQIPTFCEKPLVLDATECIELEQAALQNNCPLGINLELTYASYLEEFAELTSGLKKQTIDLQWLDPWSEQRYGETKYSDLYTNIVDDMFPHCWSILAGVAPGHAWVVKRVSYLENSDVLVELTSGDIDATVTLSRRATCRRRIVNLNQDESILDFSQEPGCIHHAGLHRELAWRGERPLTRSLTSFLQVVEDRTNWSDWPLSVVACRESVNQSLRVAEQLRQRQLNLLVSPTVGADHSSRDFRNRLIFDTCLPLAAQQHWRVNFGEEAVVQDFIDTIEDRLASGISVVEAVKFPVEARPDGI